MTGKRHAYVQEAELRLGAGADPAAVGGERPVTVAERPLAERLAATK